VPIKGLSEAVRPPRVGKLRLGVKATSQSGKEYPKAVDYFVIHEDNVTDPAMVEAFRARFGDQPRELPIVLPSNTEEHVFPQYLKCYRAGVGLWCRGDGERALRLNDDGKGMHERECPCELLEQKKCRQMATLNFLIPELPGVGVWQLTTSSTNSIINLNSAIRFIMSVTGGRIAGLPLKLRVVPKDVTVDGTKKVVHVLELAVDQLSLPQLAELAQRAAETPIFALPPVDDEPEDVMDAIEHFGHPEEREALHQQQAQAQVAQVPGFGEHPLDEPIGKHFARLRILPGQRQALLGKYGTDRQALLSALEGRPTPGHEEGASAQAARPAKAPATAEAAAGKRGGKRQAKAGAGWPAQPAEGEAPPPEEPPPNKKRDAEWLF